MWNSMDLSKYSKRDIRGEARGVSKRDMIEKDR